MLEDIESHLERRARNLDMGSSATKLLVARDAPRQDIDVDRREE
jgi:hypothetical protein